MITLTLLHPVQSTPVQSWTFEQHPVIQIGRAVDNHVVLYSAVVSRYHVELRQTEHQWEVVNLGTNGTYLDGKRVNQAALNDGSIMRLARSGPNIQIRIETSGIVPTVKTPEEDSTIDLHGPAAPPSAATQTSDLPPHLSAENGLDPSQTLIPSVLPLLAEQEANASFQVMGNYAWPPRTGTTERPLTYPCNPEQARPSAKCLAERSGSNALLCIDCGLPLKIETTLGNYHILKVPETETERYIAWRDGHIVSLKVLLQSPEQTATQVEDLAKRLCRLNHPGLPKIYEAFAAKGQIFLVSEMIYGQTLKQYVAGRGALSEAQAAAWAVDICQSLAYLHQQDPPILHQGLEPVNLIRPTIPHGLSQVVLVNFGQRQSAAGATAYLAPELHEDLPTPASDLYALGATLIYLLTQQEPDTFTRLGDQDQHFCVEEIPNLSPAMAEILQKLTQPQPEDRYASALDVLDALSPLAAT